VADGVKWFWNWIDDTYPNSIQILDFFHAKEHLCQVAKLYFADEKQRKLWIEEQIKCLMEQDAELFINKIENLPPSTKPKIDQSKQTLLEYYKTHKKRDAVQNIFGQRFAHRFGGYGSCTQRCFTA
jgi:hypothetical protein